MSATLLRHFKTRCSVILRARNASFPKIQITRVPSAARCISSTPSFHSRTLPGQKPRQFEEVPGEEHEDSRARAQRFLEESAAPVVVQDMEEFKDILVENGSYDTFMLMVLTRLQPILTYCLHHDPMEFLEGFAYSKSAVGRARDATVWLFISAHAWFTRAAAFNAPLLIPLSEDVLRLAELFEKTGVITEKFVEKQGPDVPTWFEVGSMIIDCADQAWKILPQDIDLYGEKYRDRVDEEQPEVVSLADNTQGGELPSTSASASKNSKSDAPQSTKGGSTQ